MHHVVVQVHVHRLFSKQYLCKLYRARQLTHQHLWYRMHNRGVFALFSLHLTHIILISLKEMIRINTVFLLTFGVNYKSYLKEEYPNLLAWRPAYL